MIFMKLVTKIMINKIKEYKIRDSELMFKLKLVKFKMRKIFEGHSDIFDDITTNTNV